MPNPYRKPNALERLRESGNFPRNGETWADFMARRDAEIEQERRTARRVFLFLAVLISISAVASEAMTALMPLADLVERFFN